MIVKYRTTKGVETISNVDFIDNISNQERGILIIFSNNYKNNVKIPLHALMIIINH